MNFFSHLRLNKCVLSPFRSYKGTFSSLRQEHKIFARFSSSSSSRGTYKPSTLEKYMLVWMKKFPSVAEVPSTVSNEMMEKTRNWVRIKVNIIFCVLTGVVCIAMIASGKAAAKRGENLHKKNIDWHAEINAKKDE